MSSSASSMVREKRHPANQEAPEEELRIEIPLNDLHDRDISRASDLPKEEVPTFTDDWVVGIQEMPDTTAAVNEEIAVLAYYNWERRGCPIGEPMIDWLAAETQHSEACQGIIDRLSDDEPTGNPI